MNPLSSTDEREFDELLAASSERELTSWEHDRLWTLLAESPERVERWKRHCRMVGLLGSFSEEELIEAGISVPPGNVTSMPVSPSSEKPRSRSAWIATSGGVAAALAIGYFWFGGDAEPVSIVEGAEKPEPPATPAAEEPEEKYQRIIATLPVSGSQTRPAASVSNALADASKLTVDFNNDILPILADKCFHCHGPDGESRKADLRLDTEAGAFADLGGYFAIKPGDAKASEAVLRMFEDDPDSIMPPPEFHKPMTAEEKAKIVAWIDGGAEWKGHWAFEPVVDPADPVTPKADWGNNEIDAFVLAAMKERGLSPNPEADRHALGRRAALDLTGLPPTPEERDRFLADTSATAYEDYVDRLLASPHYGEHQARFWLDAARYGDTHGMHLDNYREMWPYRDWVIDAFNENKPFDVFATEQLAGDLLENPSDAQLIATGFNRNHISTAEGGAIPAELEARYTADRTETMSTVFLGLTTGCAACHDHKYDPVSQKEFYSLAAFFANSTVPAMDGNRSDHHPTLVLPSPEHASEWSALVKQRKELSAAFDAAAGKDGLAAWWDGPGRTVRPLHPVDDAGLALYLPLDRIDGGKTIAYVSGEPVEITVGEAVAAEDHPRGRRGVRFPKPGGFTVPMGSPFAPESEVTISFWLRTPDQVLGQNLLEMIDPGDAKAKIPKTGWFVNSADRGDFTFELTDAKGTSLRNLMPAETPLKTRAWQHVAVRYTGGMAASAITFYVDGERRHGRLNQNNLAKSVAFGERLPEKLLVGKSAPTGGIADLRIYSRALSGDEIGLLAREFEIAGLYEQDTVFAELDESQKDLVARLRSLRFDSGAVAANREFMATQRRHDHLYARNPKTQVYQEADGPAMAHVLVRGEYDNLGEKVAAGVPAVFPPLASDGPADRLDLARWLFRPDHPMTARVTVNRIWQSVFGTGIVKTAGDFGIMGEKPTHPELLDFLAKRFVESGWDTKALLRTMVLSATYRQSATRSAEMLAVDPENRYLSAGPRRRLDAEVIRDQALAVSGALDRTIGGESVKPYQPPGVWEPVGFAGSNTREFKQDPLGKIHRRSVYTFWKRTAHHPALAAFNAPNREECSVVRERTNTPLQALVLMNDVQHVEAARVLAETLVREGEADPARIDEAFLRVVGRPADEADRTDLAALLEMARNQYDSDPGAAEKLRAVGDLPHDDSLDPVEVAGWTLLINTLMNRDDVLNQS